MDHTTLLSVLFALLLRCIVSLHSYSGNAQPPMFGDYEAQRHWMEITANLAPDQWYQNSTENDLLYWGLDYPPLTAYHSYLMGKIAQMINPKWVELYNSRGFEGYHHKIFMRSTVLITDILIYISALYFYWRYSPSSKANLSSTYFLRSLIVPSLILIDFGHFQYNSIALGLFIWTVILLRSERDLLATIFFCLTLNYKQMSLYYSLPVFFYLLKRCLQQKSLVRIGLKFISIATMVLITFGLLWLPYVSSVDSLLQVVRRIFPLNRGIYEDKVGNFWYCLSVFVKVKNLFTQQQLAIISATLTLSSSIPSCFLLFRKNTIQMLKYSLVNVSFAFFLFSFQVHEKTILFINIASLLLSDEHPSTVFWFSIISTFSLQPLLVKDHLMNPFFALSVIYMVVCQNTLKYNSLRLNCLFLISLIGCTVLSVTALTIDPPSRYPHIHVLLNCFYSFGHFVAFNLYFLYKQLCLYKQLSLNSADTKMTNIKPKIKTK